jgi:hypothetical protein
MNIVTYPPPPALVAGLLFEFVHIFGRDLIAFVVRIVHTAFLVKPLLLFHLPLGGVLRVVSIRDFCLASIPPVVGPSCCLWGRLVMPS